MERKAPDDSVVVHAMSERFRKLIRTLVRGNARRARSLAARMRDQVETLGEPIALQNLIEDMAQGQAFRNAFINIPSAVPGIGTVISWVLISVADFFTLDQGVTLVLALGFLGGLDPDDHQQMEDLAILVIGEAYGLEPSGPERDSGTVARKIITSLLPRRYVNIGVNRWAKAFVKRLLPFRRKSRLLPAGFGIAMAAWDAYETIVKVGRIARRELAFQGREKGLDKNGLLGGGT